MDGGTPPGNKGLRFELELVGGLREVDVDARRVAGREVEEDADFPLPLAQLALLLF